MTRSEKQKWSEDPQNSRWSRDKSKYGFRMLQQMGWQEGKGLGAKEEGDTKHVRISRKKDNSGVGTKRGRDDDWIECQDAFDKILAGLTAVGSAKEGEAASDEATPPQGKTLVDSAVEAKKIVYKRFLRSKDLSAQSSEDLDCVLGRKRRKGSKQEALSEGGNGASMGSAHGVTTINNGQSVQEYFALKMAAMTGNTETAGQEEEEEEEEEEGKPSKSEKRKRETNGERDGKTVIKKKGGEKERKAKTGKGRTGK